MPQSLSAAQAARMMLTAQGFARPRPAAVTMRQVQQTINRLAQFQIDSVNVVTRAHYLPLFSRLGGYNTGLLDRALGGRPRRLFEYWGHAACAIDIALQPALRHKMTDAAQQAWGSMTRIARDHPGLVETIKQAVAEHGPASARQIEAVIEAPTRNERTDWGWNWSHTKSGLEWLFWCGEITAADRNPAFERRYDLPERVLPQQISAQPTPDRDEAYRILVGRAAQALGITTADWAAEYFRISKPAAATALAELAESGTVLPVQVAGWPRDAWVWHAARIPQQVNAQALVCPFDPLLFDRARLKQVFGINYRIEIYVPAAQRRHGYYVYPLLLGEQFAARVDLKADRLSGVLRVQSAWLEPGHRSSVAEILDALAAELFEMADWLDLSGVVAAPAGDLGAQLVKILR